MNDGGEEMVEVLDPAGAVVDIVPRSTMRARSLPHRSTYVMVMRVETPGWVPAAGDIDAGGEIDSWAGSRTWSEGLTPHRPIVESLRAHVTPATPVVVHQRADWKDVYPSHWDLGFGGVCSAGEPWMTSARRELAEEAGIVDVVLRPVGHGRFTDDSGTVFGLVFVAATTQPATIIDGEVVVLDEIALGDLERWTSGREVCPDSMALVLPLLLSLLEDR